MLRDVFQQRYNQLLQKYEVSKLDAGYGIEPYLRIYWMSDRLNSKFRIKRIFNTEDPDRFDLQKNWDMALSLQVVF